MDFCQCVFSIMRPGQEGWPHCCPTAPKAAQPPLGSAALFGSPSTAPLHGANAVSAAAVTSSQVDALQHQQHSSLACLWGTPRPRQPTPLPTDTFPRRPGFPLGCAVQRAADAVHAGSTEPPIFPGMHAFEEPAAFGVGRCGGASLGTLNSSWRGTHSPGFGSPGVCMSPTAAAATASIGDRASAQSGTFCHSPRPLGPLGEDRETVEGWGASGWGGDCAGVKQTSGDAATSKLSAALLGYFPDEFLSHFVTQPIRMQPLINRGEKQYKIYTSR